MPTAPGMAFALEIDGLTAPTSVMRFAVSEALSEGSTAEVVVGVTEPVDACALVGKKGALRVSADRDAGRWFHGVVLEAEATVRDVDGRGSLRVVLGARALTLKHARDSRIFQKKSVKDIVQAVLDAQGLGEMARWMVTRAPSPRAYVVQYDETDWDFVRRLLQDEGIGFAVRHEESEDTLVFFDDDHGAAPMEGVETLLDRDATQLSENVVWAVRESRAVSFEGVVRRDYDLARPSLDLTAEARAPRDAGHEHYDHPGGYTEAAEGRRRAQAALERLRARCHRVSGESDCYLLEPGRRFAVEGHPRAAINGELVVTSTRHEGAVTTRDGVSEASHVCRWEAKARAAAWRPDGATPAKEASGPVVAWVTTASGEEIHTDDFGRVKVRFPWDRTRPTDDRSSTWLRVGQAMLGGAMMHPRKDFEVIVDHELGERDRPFVSGHVYNVELAVPYALPDNAARTAVQTATTGGGPGSNELRFDDGAGAEEIFLNASKDMTVSIEHDATWHTDHDESVTIGGDHTMSVGTVHQRQVGGARSLSVGGSQSLNVGGSLGENVGGSASTTIGAARMVTVGGDLSEQVQGSLSRTVGGMQCITAIAGFNRNVVGDATTTVGAALIQVCGRSNTSDAGGSRRLLVGAVELIRAKQVSVSCSAAYTETAAAEVIKCGGSRTDTAGGALALSAGGGVSVKAADAVIEAKSSLTVLAGACVIKLSSSGNISIKAAKVDLTGAKTLGQVLHRSN
jgi:type VI secretion system secreted protein VgrG